MGWELGIGSWKNGHAKKKRVRRSMDEVGVLVGELKKVAVGISSTGVWGSNQVWLTRVSLINKEVRTLGWVIKVYNLDW
jgi:hypothetical protein